MPGLALLKSADPGDLRVRYRDIQTGAEIQCSSSNPKVVWALHAQTYPIWKCPTHSIDSSRYTDASNTTGRVKSPSTRPIALTISNDPATRTCMAAHSNR